ncbi:MAG: tetratricopeptide repeat protein [Deltaproteobacteria bacterium]|nr:tetratricopeptide repeat protein [Deltaproteobacteria bacterium]
MALLTLSKYLGLLQDDPNDQDAFDGISQVISTGDSELLGEQPIRLLEKARERHLVYGDIRTIAKLIELELKLVPDDPRLEAALWQELGRIYYDELLEVDKAVEAYQKAAKLNPDLNEVNDALKQIEQATESWQKFAKRFIEEAESATDVSLKTSLLIRAACLIWQYKRKGRVKESEKLLAKVLEIDPGNIRAARLYTQTIGSRGNAGRLGQILLEAAEHAREKDQRIGFFLQAARVFAQEPESRNRAAACYERVLDLAPTNSEGLRYLVEYFTETEQWDHLVGLYEDALRARQTLEVEQGILLQIGMVHWRMRASSDQAEVYFDRLRKLEPGHPAVLDFYREYLREKDDIGRLLNILADAQRVVSEKDRRLDLAIEMARTAQANPSLVERSIDSWKLVQRIDPSNTEASTILKELYRETGKWNALVEIIKAEIDILSEQQIEAKVALLRELVDIYRDHLKMDVMVINSYNAILKLIPDDDISLTALAEKYEAMGRWNDLIRILNQKADVARERATQVEYYLRVASLWVERFANYNQATQPLEAVLQLDPDNREALAKLKDIYVKKRAWQALYELLGKESERSTDSDTVLNNTIEMARIAGERLHRYDEAVGLWRDVLAKNPRFIDAIDALERLAEQSKNWPVLAEALEKRLDVLQNDDERIKTLQKLGAIYTEQTLDQAASVKTWRRVLQLDPKNGRARRTLRDMFLDAKDWDGLEALYADGDDWEALVDVFGSVAEKTEDAQLRIDLSFRAARVYEDKIGEPQRAFRSYERILSVDATNVQAARALVPIYEREEKWPKLSGVLEVLLKNVPKRDKAERLVLLGRLRDLALEQLRDSAAAFDYAMQAYRIAPDDEDTRMKFELAAERASAFDRLVEAFVARLNEAPDDEAFALRRRIAAVALEELSRIDLAVEQLRAVIKLSPEDPEAIATLDQVFRSQDRIGDLRELLVHRLGIEHDDAVRWQLLKEIAQIEEEKLNDPASAADRYREMSVIDPDNREVLLTLDRLAVEAERYEELAEILQRRRALEQDQRAQTELDARLGILYAQKLDDCENAIGVFESVLESDSGHGQAIAELEKIAEDRPQYAYRINRLLESAYRRSERFNKLHEVLQRLLKLSEDREEIEELRLQLAEISGQKLGDQIGAYAALEAAFRDRPTDSELWNRLYEAAELAQQHKALVACCAQLIASGSLQEVDAVELSARAAKLYEEVLGQPEEAEPFHRRVLASDPLNDTSFIALKKLLTSLERWEDLQTLYRERIDQTFDSATKLELLLQVCFLFEEILDAPEKAIEAYQSVLDLEPNHAPAIRTLEGLYQRTERWTDLAALLRRKLDQAEGQDAIELMLQLGELYESKLGKPATAVDNYEAVLGQQPTLLRAQEALERLIGVPDQRQRIAAILEPLYESQGAYTDLVRILGIQLEAIEHSGERASLLRRVAELQENRLRDLAAAFKSYSLAVEADPADSLAREDLARVSENREAYRRERVRVLENAIEASQASRDLHSDLLLEQAQLLDQRLGDFDAAERVYQRLIEIDPENPDRVLTAASALERIHMTKGDHAAQAADIDLRVRFETDPQVCKELLVRLGGLYEDILDNLEGAISAHKKRLENDPDDVDAMVALERLYERTKKWPQLVDILQGRDAVEKEESERCAIACRVGLIYEEKLDDRDNAIVAYNDVLDRFGPIREALTALSRMYEASERWEDLLDIIRMRHDQAQDPIERAELRFKCAELMRTRTRNLEEAIEAYEEVLQELPEHDGSLAALDSIMSDAESAYRIDAARVARPRYEVLARYDKLLMVLDVLASTEEPSDRLLALRRAADVAEMGLHDLSRAFTYAGEAVRVGLSDDDLPRMLSEYHRLAEACGRYTEYLQTLRDIAPDIFSGEIQSEVYRKIAEVARTQFNDVVLTREYFGRVLELLPEDKQALDALETLNAEIGDYEALIEILTRKHELAEDPGTRRRLLLQKAEIYERRLEDSSSAISALEDVVKEVSDEHAYEALERLYTKEQRWPDLVAMVEQQLDRKVGNAVELHYKLGKNYLVNLAEPYRALEHLREAIEEDTRHEPTIELLESLMSEASEHRAIAAEILEPGYLARMEWSKLTSVLEARIEMEIDPEERKRLFVRLGQIYEDQLEDFAHALEVYGRLFREDPRNEDVWETLTRLAKVGERWGRLADIFGEVLEETEVDDEVIAKLAMQTGKLCDERTQDLEKAAKFYVSVLRFDPAHQQAFTSLESVYQRTGAHELLLELYRSQADIAESEQQRIKLLHKRADVFLAALKDSDGAIESYREILEVNPKDAVATESLDELYTKLARWSDLADHLRHRIDQNLGTAEEVELKYRLAELLATRLDDKVGAIDLYEEITHLNRAHQPTIGALEVLVQDIEHRLRITQILEPIYRHLDQWKKLVAIFEAQLELLEDPGDGVRLLSEIAELHEIRGQDAIRAFDAWSRAFVIEPVNDKIRANLDRLAAAMGAWDELVATYDLALQKTDDPGTITTMLTTIARVHDEKRGDPRSAIKSYERLLAHDPTDPTPYDSLEALHTMVGDWRGLVDVFERRLEQTFDAQERGELFRRLGSVLEELLNDQQGAIDAYRRAVEEDDTDTISLESLDRLYSATADYTLLSDILKRRIELAVEPAERAALGLRLGDLTDEHLRNAEQAIDAYQRVLEDQPGDRHAVNALVRLYQRQAMWPELLENLKLQVSIAESDSERVALLQRAGEVLEREMDDVMEAIGMYRDALQLDPSYDPAIEALLRIVNLELYRIQVAEILDPLLRQQERWNELARVMELTVEAISDPYERRDEFKRLAEIHEQGRMRPEDAFEVLCRALAEDPADGEIIASLERLAEHINAWDKLANVFGEQASSTPSPADSCALYQRLARIAEQRLSDDTRAIEALVRKAEQDDDPNETLADLDRLYLKTEQWDSLAQILERRLNTVDIQSNRNELLVRLGELREQRFSDNRGAFAVFQEVLESEPDNTDALQGLQRLTRDDALALEVVEILENAYRPLGYLEKILELYEIKIRLADSNEEKVRMLQEAASMLESDLHDLPKALATLKRAFELDPGNESLLDELERLAEAANAYDELRGLVESAVRSAQLDKEYRQSMVLRAAAWYRDRLNDEAAAESCLRAAIQAVPESLDAHAQLVELLRRPGRESELNVALRAWALVESDEIEKREHFREAARLAEESLGDIDLAAQCLQDVLAVDDRDVDALDNLARIRSLQQRWKEVIELLSARIEGEADLRVRLDLRYRIAELHAGPLGQHEKAIEAYRELLEEEPNEKRASRALQAIFEETKRWEELRELLEQSLDRAETSTDRIAVRIQLARLAELQFDERYKAIEQLNEILAEDPRNRDALDELERLYTVDERWVELGELLSRRADAAFQATEAEEEIAVLLRLGELNQNRLRDNAAAIAAYSRILERRPEHIATLRDLIGLYEQAQDWERTASAMEQLLDQLEGEEAIESAYRIAELTSERLGDAPRSETLLLRAFEIDPASSQTRERLRAHYEKYEQHQKLIDLLQSEIQGLADAESKGALYRRMADLYSQRLGDPARAAECLEQAVKLVPDDRSVLLPLCDFYIAADRQSDAIPVLERIIESYGGRRAKEVAVYHHRLGQALQGVGEDEKALQHFDAAFKIDLTNIHILRDLGLLCLRKGDLDRAQKTFRALLLQKLGADAGIKKADVYFYLGQIAAKQGEKAKAVSMLERAVSEAGDHPQARELLATL